MKIRFRVVYSGELKRNTAADCQNHEIMDFYGVDGGVAQNTMATDMVSITGIEMRCRYYLSLRQIALNYLSTFVANPGKGLFGTPCSFNS